MLTTPEALAILGVSRSTIDRWRFQGVLKPAAQLPGPNGAYLWDRKAVERLAAARALFVPATEETP